MHINTGGQGRPLSANLGTRWAALKPGLAASTPQQSQQNDPGSAASALGTADLTQMLTLMQKLSSQVDELTMRIAGQSES
jgi:hypothetical protein